MLKVQIFTCNAFAENAYLVYNDETRHALLIDPGFSCAEEFALFKKFMEQEKLELQRVLLTHCHFDHVMGTGFVKEAYGVPICGSMDEFQKLPSPSYQSQLFGVPITTNIAPVDTPLHEGDALDLDGHSIQILDVPGHSFHGYNYYLEAEDVLFSGDVLFRMSVGRSDFGDKLGCDGEALLQGVRKKLFSLPPATIVLPGHGPQTVIRDEMLMNPYFYKPNN